MGTFIEAADAALSRDDVAPARRELWRQFCSIGLPTAADEVWRYAPLSSFDLDRYDPLGAARGDEEPSVWSLPNGVALTHRDLATSAEFLNAYGDDAFALLAGAMAGRTVEVTVPAGLEATEPITVVHDVRGSLTCQRVKVTVGAGASARVVERWRGGADALVATVVEYEVAAGGSLDVATYQGLDHSSWHVARSTAHLAAGATFHQACVGVGGGYNRARNDAVLAGLGAENTLRTTFFGDGAQVHDFRTHQHHLAPRTKSALLSKGAVAGRAQSIYTGLIEIEKGAKKTDARQRNFNLLLSATAHADAVPNLDIKENDVVCAHASSVGPLDEDERWYLESRGVDRGEAERLLVEGFFEEMTDALPAELAASVRADLAALLAKTRG